MCAIGNAQLFSFAIGMMMMMTTPTTASTVVVVVVVVVASRPTSPPSRLFPSMATFSATRSSSRSTSTSRSRRAMPMTVAVAAAAAFRISTGSRENVKETTVFTFRAPATMKQA